MSIHKILVVDDSPADLENLKTAVNDSGAKIITATSGTEALAKCQAEKPDIVFLDVVMDDLDGYKTCRELTKGETTKDIPIVFVTSKNNRADKLWAEKQGARAMISKPYTKADIEEQVNRFR